MRLQSDFWTCHLVATAIIRQSTFWSSFETWSLNVAHLQINMESLHPSSYPLLRYTHCHFHGAASIRIFVMFIGKTEFSLKMIYFPPRILTKRRRKERKQVFHYWKEIWSGEGKGEGRKGETGEQAYILSSSSTCETNSYKLCTQQSKPLILLLLLWSPT